MRCSHCSTETRLGDLWCWRCGAWSSSNTAICEQDEAQQAVGVCVVCGVPVCGQCLVEKDGRMFCADPLHHALYETHVLLGNYVSEFEADWVSRNLMISGVRARMFAYRSRPGLYGLSLHTEASVYVHREDELKAREILGQYADTKGA